jgi:electron transfer flavoprotein alpha subunit
MSTILILPESGDDSALELAAAARALGDGRVVAAVTGHDVDTSFAGACDAVHVFDDERLAVPDGDLRARLFAPLVGKLAPDVVLVAHTNAGLDFAPALAGRCGATLVADCIALEPADGGLRVVRTLYGGKAHARMDVAGKPVLATVRPGAFAASDATGAGEIHTEEVPADLAARRRFVETVAPEPGAVDLTQAEVLVAVGRGIEDQENIEIVEALVEALGAELACTRPVVDKGWLPKSRQVGTSGTTVKPKVYLAIGVSGSFQHMGGVKGGPFVAAINKDPAAPIFGVADVGIVGDLFDLVPLLEEKVRQRKG